MFGDRSKNGSPVTEHSDSILSRHECKYLVPVHALDRVRANMRPFMRPDEFAVDKPGGRYQVTSVYLDSPDLALYQMTADGIKNRFKLRMRWYGDDVDQPVFLEIKRRADLVVRKRRAAVDLATAANVLLNGTRPTSLQIDGLAALPAVREFSSLASRARARPVLLVRYWREAYESLGPDPLRITFDTSLEYAMTKTGALLGRGEKLVWKSTPNDGAIIEIKFTELYPAWVRDLITELQLQKQSVPKYCLSIDQAIRSGDYLDVPRGWRPTDGNSSVRTRAGWGV